MKRCFVDTNVFPRFLAKDDGGQSHKAARLFAEASQGKVHLLTGAPVLFELYWTLRSGYSVPREKALEVLGSVLALRGLRLTDHDTAEQAIGRARLTSVDFPDAYIATAAKAAQADSIASFNRKDFERLGASLFEW